MLGFCFKGLYSENTSEIDMVGGVKTN